MTTATYETVQVGDLTMAYRELGSGDPVLLLHGWPTSSLLWRDVMPAIAEAGRRAIALDLPGFGFSSKPLDVTYDLAFQTAAVGGFLDALGIAQTALAVHDLGGPVGVRFALDNPGRITQLALLNTLLFPEDGDEQGERFMEAMRTSEGRERFTSDEGLQLILRFGMAREDRVTPEALDAISSPFTNDDERLALAKAILELEQDAMVGIARDLPAIDVPVRVVYGRQDRVLTKIEGFVERVQAALPQAEVTAIDDAGHFVQEDAPEEVGALLAEFLRR